MKNKSDSGGTLHEDYKLVHVANIDIFRKPFEVKYFKQTEHDVESCSDCQTLKAKLINILEERRMIFPTCCENHKLLLTDAEFDYLDYTSSPESIANKIIYSYNHIKFSLKNKDWKQDIENYLEYVLDGFGRIPTRYGGVFGFSDYITLLKSLLEEFYKLELDEKDITKVKETIECLLSFTNQGRDINDNNIGNLYDIYTRWLENFPFNLPFFKDKKNYHFNRIGIYTGEKVYNPYLNKTNYKIYTASELIKFLDSTTIEILDSIRTDELLKDKYITKENQYKLDLIKLKHRLNHKIDLNRFKNFEIPYSEAIKKWVDRELNFIKEIIPIFNPNKNKHIINHTILIWLIAGILLSLLKI